MTAFNAFRGMLWGNPETVVATALVFADAKSALVRTDSELALMRANDAGKWFVDVYADFPQDWLMWRGSGFRTFVSPDLLKTACDGVIDACRSRDVSDISHDLSISSPVLPGTRTTFKTKLGPRESEALEPDSWTDERVSIKALRIVAVEGRYAVAVVTTTAKDKSRPEVGRDAVAMVTFRADDGKTWKVYSAFDVDVDWHRIQ